MEEAEAVTNFDRHGQGLLAVNLDGQLVQILASLSRDDQKFGVRVRAGERLSITAVNAKRNSCTVTRLPLTKYCIGVFLFPLEEGFGNRGSPSLPLRIAF